MRLPRISLDHVGTLVHDLSRAADRWEALGFRLAPVSRQRGPLPGRNESAAWATANRCAIFSRGYLEVIGVVDPGGFNPWSNYLSRSEGTHIVALRVPDIERAFANVPAKASVHSPVERDRRLMAGLDERTLRFRHIFSRDESYPEGRWILIEHLTPEVLWEPSFTVHPNGARALAAAFVVADDLAAAALRVANLTGLGARLAGPDTLRVVLPEGGEILIFARSAFAARFGVHLASEPDFAGAAVEFADREAAIALMRKSGVPVRSVEGRAFVPPEFANGMVLELRQAG